jgi:hypothetical protein
MKTKNLVIFIVMAVFISKVTGQDLNNVNYPEMISVNARQEMKLPDIEGYKTLKCDFHMHTVFSDGIVWPEYRVEEAWREGLDAIAITDHIEKQPSKKYISGDHNSSYDLALPEATEKNILLIRAGEITRSMPPGHLNALFVDDVNKLDVSSVMDALEEAKKQGAFILWNHPGWKAQQPDTCLWMPKHQELFEKGLMHGIEVFNEYEYYPVVLDWCINKKLTVIGNSDIHGIVADVYDLRNQYRPVTLVFAKERSIAAIKEALFAGRTLALFNNILAGKEDLLLQFFRASVSVKSTGRGNLYEVSNNSIINYEITGNKNDLLIIPAESKILISIKNGDYTNVKVRNLYTGSESCLTLTSLK